MNLYNELSSRTVKTICEYFNGDYEKSIYVYRTGSELADLYSMRFRGPDYIVGVSRWCLCESAMKFMAERDQLSDFFAVMLKFVNVKKELKGKTDEEIIEARKNAINYLNEILLQDDYELTDVSGRIYFSKIDDKNNLIGEGGFAKVYSIPGTNTVIKKLKDEFKGNASIVSRFKNEYAILSTKLLGVDGIIKAYSFDKDAISYTMEYCETDLKKYINENFLSEDDKSELILQILEIMDNVHKKKVLHRDLSPKNIFIKDGKPIIADFGLGKAIDSDGRTYVTVDTSYQGTLEYCDPRQFQGLGFADEQSDIYSLGKIINFIMTKNSENFDHSLSIITTIATQTSLAARYHSVEELINKVKLIKKLDSTGDYTAECLRKIEKGIYDAELDEYLLSTEGEDLIIRLYDPLFVKVYFNLFNNKTYDAVLIEKLNSINQRLDYPIGLAFNSLDPLGIALIDLMINKGKNLSPAIKDVVGKCIYDIACGVGRWAPRNHLAEYYKRIEPIYIEESIIYLKEQRIIK